jgi:hypothetical protein
MAVEPKMDFRYVDTEGVEIEAFKVTKGARWASHDWPPWLNTQGTVEELNKVYTDPSRPNSLFINLPAGRFAIADDAYVILGKGGTLDVSDGEIFEAEYTKVVPLPPRPMDEESLAGFEDTHKLDENNQLVALSPEELEARQLAKPPVIKSQQHLEVLDEQGVDIMAQRMPSELRSKAETTLELMQDGQTEAAISTLVKALADETVWCSCAPGSCSGGPRWSCRQNSPLAR